MVVVRYNLMIDTLTFSRRLFTNITEHKMTKTKILTNLGLVFLLVLLLLRFFLGRLYGVFILCILIYFLCYDIFGFKPFTPMQLLEWFNIQSEGTKNSIIGALITVIGFMVAYASTSQNWKNQERVKLKLKAADEIEKHVTACTDLIIKTNIYAEWLIDSHKRLSESYEYNEANFIFDYNKEMSSKFISNRDAFIANAQAIHQLKARHFGLISQIGKLDYELDIIIDCISNISEKIWFNVPISYADNRDIEGMYSQIDVNLISEFVESVKNCSDQISGRAGAICGALRSDIIDFSFCGLKNLYKKRNDVEAYFNMRSKNITK